MFRRRTSSSGKIHYRINIDKSMCPNPVDIYIDGDTYQHSFNGSSLDIYRNKKIEVIRIGGQISQKDQQYEYNVLLGITGGVSKGTLTYLYDSGVTLNTSILGFLSLIFILTLPLMITSPCFRIHHRLYRYIRGHPTTSPDPIRYVPSYG